MIKVRIKELQIKQQQGDGWLPDADTLEASGLPENFLKNYKMEQESPQNCYVNTFG